MESEEELWKQLPKVEGEERAELLMALCERAVNRDSGEEALALAETARDIYHSMGATAPSADLARAYYWISCSIKALGRTREAAQALEKVLEIHREAHFPYLDDLLRTQALWYGEVNDWTSALHCQLEAVRLNEMDGNVEWTAKSVYNAGYCYSQIGEHGQAILYFTEARRLFKRLRDVLNVGQCDERTAESQIAMGDGEKALKNGLRALDVANILQRDGLLLSAHFVVGQARMLTKDEEGASIDFAVAKGLVQSCTEIDWSLLLKIEQAQADLFREDAPEFTQEIEKRIASIKEILEE